MQYEDICQEYEKILLKKRKNYSVVVLSKTNKDSEKNAIQIFRYAAEKLLNWTSEEFIELLNDDIIKIMKLDIPLKYIDVPLNLDSDTRNKYLAKLIWKNKVRFTNKDLTLSIYKKIINDELYAFPKKFFNEDEGKERSQICLAYAIQNLFPKFHSPNELYKYFITTNCTKELKNAQLIAAYNELYDAPIDYLHETLNENQRNEFLYHYYKFKLLYNKEKKALAKEAKGM